MSNKSFLTTNWIQKIYAWIRKGIFTWKKKKRDKKLIMQSLKLDQYKIWSIRFIMRHNSKHFTVIFDLLALVPNKTYCKLCFRFLYLFLKEKKCKFFFFTLSPISPTEWDGCEAKVRHRYFIYITLWNRIRRFIQ